jgi:hypothetical protein
MGQLQLRFASPLPPPGRGKNKTKKAVRACDNVGRVAQVEDPLPSRHYTSSTYSTLYLGHCAISVIGECSNTKWAPPALITRIIGICFESVAGLLLVSQKRSLGECLQLAKVVILVHL